MCGYLDVPAVEGADDVDLGVAALVPLVHNVDDVVRVVDPETEHGIKARAGDEPLRSLKFHNHEEDPYSDLCLVESGYYHFHI